MDFWYVYFLKSIPKVFVYVGSTDNLHRRVTAHNNGDVQSTKAYKPLELAAYVAVRGERKAASPRIEVEKFVFQDLHTAKSLVELRKVEAMKGYDGFYKVRFGVWRLGLRFDNDVLFVERTLHRKEIYRFFP